ncbi:MAG: hydroxymethylbilane synthase [Acidobacteriota bacterium]
MRRLVIGTRGSPLARWQAKHIGALLTEVCEGLQVTLRVIKTLGDEDRKTFPAALGAKGIFVKEIEAALLDGRIDLAVHSVKDLPGELAAGLALGAIPTRDDPRDALVSSGGRTLQELPQGAWLGTAAVRRRAQLLRVRPDLHFRMMRGNVGTRILKVRNGEVDGVVLAVAGLQRLGEREASWQPLPVEVCLPAPGQGALGVQARAADEDLLPLLRRIDDLRSRREVTAEKTVMAALEAGCLAPLGVLARHRSGRLRLTARVISPEGRDLVQEELEGDPGDFQRLGGEVAARLEKQGASELLRRGRARPAGWDGRPDD